MSTLALGLLNRGYGDDSKLMVAELTALLDQIGLTNAELVREFGRRGVDITEQGVGKWRKKGQISHANLDVLREIARARSASNLVRVLQLDANGDMGDGAQNDDFPDVVRAMDFTANYIRGLIGFVPAPGRLRLITGRNDSMIPVINPGDVVIVDTGVTCFDGDGIYLINTGNGQQIKGLQDRGNAIFVVSANAQLYPAFALPAGSIIGGKVYLRNRIDRLS